MNFQKINHNFREFHHSTRIFIRGRATHARIKWFKVLRTLIHTHEIKISHKNTILTTDTKMDPEAQQKIFYYGCFDTAYKTQGKFDEKA